MKKRDEESEKQENTPPPGNQMTQKEESQKLIRQSISCTREECSRHIAYYNYKLYNKIKTKKAHKIVQQKS